MAELKYYRIDEVPQCKVHGRTVRDARNEAGEPVVALFWNGAGVEVNCTGGELWIDVETDSDFFEPWIATELNGSLMSRQMLLPGTHSICLYRSMTPGTTKNMRFFRELQAMGEDEKTHVLVKGFRTDGDFLPVEDKKLKLEFIGDSITSGEGTYGATSDTEWLTMYMSSSRHYANILSKRLDADVRIISQGGWGVYCGWDNDVRHNIPSIYEKVCGLATGAYNERLGAQEPYDFAWQPEAVVINLGTNDNSAFSQPPFTDPDTGIAHKQRVDENGYFVREDAEKVEKAVIDFLKMLRRHYPKALLVWAYGMLGYNLTVPLTEAISTYMRESGDTNCAFLNIPNTLPDEYGAHMHPGYASHQKAAVVLENYLREKLGL